MAAVGLVDYLSHSDHVVVVVADRHAQYQIGRVARHVIDFPVKPWVLYKHVILLCINEHKKNSQNTQVYTE